MKKAISILIIFFALLIIPTFSKAECDIIESEQLGTDFSTYVSVGAYNFRTYLADLTAAGEFSNSFNCCKIEVSIKASGNPTQNFGCKIYNSTDTGAYTNDNPYQLLYTSTNIVDSSNISSNGEWVSFHFDSVPLSNSVNYWVVLYTDDTSDDNNFIYWDRTSSHQTTKASEQRQGNGTTWGGQSHSRTAAIRLYSSEEDPPDPPPEEDPSTTFKVAIRWDAPCFNEDGSKLEDLKGFKLYATEDNVFVRGSNVIYTLTNNVVASPIIQGTNSSGAYGETYTAEVAVSNSLWYALTAFDFHRNESDFSEALFLDKDTPSRPTNLYINVNL